MFTGLVEAMGTFEERRGARSRIACPFAAQLEPGESVAVNGVCLTVEEADAGGFWATVVGTTARRTTLGALPPGRAVNLERAVRAGAPMGGHVVQGHVDAVGTLEARRPDGAFEVLGFRAPAEVLRHVVARGSIAVDGVSLTVAGLVPGGFEVGIVPHTAAATTLGRLEAGSAVNLESDILAKYVAAAVAAFGAPGAGGEERA
jgi:riboflavin synthase